MPVDDIRVNAFLPEREGAFDVGVIVSCKWWGDFGRDAFYDTHP